MSNSVLNININKTRIQVGYMKWLIHSLKQFTVWICQLTDANSITHGYIRIYEILAIFISTARAIPKLRIKRETERGRGWERVRSRGPSLNPAAESNMRILNPRDRERKRERPRRKLWRSLVYIGS
jgi:hypothetical protein